MKKQLIILLVLCFSLFGDQQRWLTYEGKEGPGKGKHIVLISGDEEYRSEESLPMLARILSERHGFKCTVLFAIDPKTGAVNPYVNDNIPGLQSLENADLMINCLRWRQLPDGQMKFFDDYLKAGKPVLGLRTSNHAFNNKSGNYTHYAFKYEDKDPKHPWHRGFGGLLFGDHYNKHHGKHRHESTRGIFAKGAVSHQLLNGIKDGEIWGPTDVYGCRVSHLDITPIIMGQVLKRERAFDENDRFYGNRPTDKVLEGMKNNPMIPVAWLKDYKHPQSSQRSQTFHTSMGSSTDLESIALRRLVVNATYHLLKIKIPKEGTNVDLVGEYFTKAYGFWGKEYWEKLKMKVSHYK
jgi:hypothetical protein